MHVFALTSQLAIQILSIVHSISGVIGFASYMFHAFQKKEIIDHRKLCIFGSVLRHNRKRSPYLEKLHSNLIFFKQINKLS